MIVFKLEDDGGFVVGDTETRVAAYAYPTSEYASKARAKPHSVANRMATDANKFHPTFSKLQLSADYYARLWARLEV
jgi:hypothetical protein